MKKYNALHDNEPTEPPRELKIQPLVVHFKSHNSYPKHIPVVSSIIGIKIIMQWITVILKSILYIILLCIPLILYHICITHPLSLSMMNKCNNSCNSSNQSMMKIFLILTSRCPRLDYWLLLLQTFIHFQRCCFINTENKCWSCRFSVALLYVSPNQR